MLSFHTPCPDLPALQQPGGASGAAAMEGQLSSGAKEQGVKGLQFPLPPPPGYLAKFFPLLRLGVLLPALGSPRTRTIVEQTNAQYKSR